MSGFKEFLRDFIGILFPGAFILLIVLWFIINISYLICPEFIVLLKNQNKNWLFIGSFIVFAYIAGELFRIKQMNKVEEIWTDYYRNRVRKKQNSSRSINLSIENIQNEFDDGYRLLENRLNHTKKPDDYKRLLREYCAHHERFSLWEYFPYPNFIRFWRLLRHSIDYRKFYEKFDKEGITDEKTFFHFCKNVVYENSPPLKDELVRQESMIRLCSGLYYSVQYGYGLLIITFVCQLIFLFHPSSTDWLIKIGIPDSKQITVGKSLLLTALNALFLFLSWYIISELKKRVRFMRVKELQIGYDSFYIVCRKKNIKY
jgi:hypothetical protein